MNDARPGILPSCLVSGLMLALMSTPPVLSQVPKPSATKTAKAVPKPLSEATRKQIYWEGFAIEHKAERAAKARYPVDPTSNDFMQQLKTNQAYADSLIAKDESALRRRYGITEDEYDKIIVEGVKNNWPRPPAQP